MDYVAKAGDRVKVVPHESRKRLMATLAGRIGTVVSTDETPNVVVRLDIKLCGDELEPVSEDERGRE